MEGDAAVKRKLLFLATEDWFVRSHFAPLVARAGAEGYEVVVAARLGGASADLQAMGARVVALKHARGDNGALAMLAALAEVRALLAAEQPALVHAIALKPCFLAALARRAAPRAGLVCAITGRGHLATAAGPSAALTRALLRAAIMAPARAGAAHILVENRDDLAWLAGARPLAAERATILPGAGVEVERFAVAPEPPGPVRIGLVARLVRSKGVDVAVAAFAALRAAGADVELHIAGEPDADNPGAYQVRDLEAWRAAPGVRLHGRVEDVAAFWARMHLACLPSRGGEGLPRTLIEAAASGRPIVTTDVPGCRDFVEDGVSGLLAPAGDTATLARRLATLAGDAGLRARLGAAGRAKVERGYTSAHVADLVASAWARALDARA